MDLFIQSHNPITNGWNIMELILYIWQWYGDAIKVCYNGFISDIQELEPFDCLHFNVLVSTEPYLGKESIDFHET